MTALDPGRIDSGLSEAGLSEVGSIDLRTPIDEYLARQRDLSAVERFADHHDRAEGPLLERWYRDLLPATAPGPGQQYRFEVDMDACTSCKACVSACNSLNGLDDGEAFRSVGVVIGDGPAGPTQQTVTTACHHCVDPACLSGCPVNAYDKDPITGIVKHLDDQCIGCSYCLWTCPYEVPKFNDRLGIVRKCDMCSDRLAEGEAPACVQACPNGAIAIGIVDVDELRSATVHADRLVPGAPSSGLTIPTTRYERAEALPSSAVATDVWDDRPNHVHGPLVSMLVATQIAVGGFVALVILGAVSALGGAGRQLLTISATGLVLAGIAASLGHLGRPQYAWRAVLGIRRSWLSREIVCFGAVAPLALLATGSVIVDGDGAAATLASGATAAVGAAAVACSVAIYAVTGRRFWRLDRTASAFATTTIVGGTSLATVALLLGDQTLVSLPAVASLALVGGVTGAGSLDRERCDQRGSNRDDELARSLALLTGPLAEWAKRRRQLGWAGALVAPAVVCLAVVLGVWHVAAAAAVAGFVATAAGELISRRLFFAAMTAPRMPGVPR